MEGAIYEELAVQARLAEHERSLGGLQRIRAAQAKTPEESSVLTSRHLPVVRPALADLLHWLAEPFWRSIGSS